MGKKSKYKTSVKKKTLNPEFNEVQLHTFSAINHTAANNFFDFYWAPNVKHGNLSIP